jgi:hypothetical protein
MMNDKGFIRNVRALIEVLSWHFGTRGSVVGLGAMLQAGWSRFRFPMSSLGFSINLVFPAALWLLY